MRSLAFFILPLVALSEAASAQSMTPNSPDQIAAATVDCWESVTGGLLDLAKFEARGWKKPNLTTQDGKPFNPPLSTYTKSDSTVFVVLLPKPGAEDSCRIVSRVATPDDIDKSAHTLLNKLRQTDSKAEMKRYGRAYVFRSEPRGATLESIGSSEQPAIKIVVVNAPLEKQ